MKDLKEQIKETLYSYRVQADMAYSEVTDKFHTQKEYEEALERINNTHTLSIQKIIDSTLQAFIEAEIEREEWMNKFGRTFEEERTFLREAALKVYLNQEDK